MKIAYLIALSPLVLAACAGQPLVVTPPTVTTGPSASAPAPQTDPLTQLATFTVADLMAATADAKSQTPPDVTASQCYDFLIQLIPTIKVPGQGNTVGAILAFQQLRDLNNGVSAFNGIKKSLNLACAPLVIDTQTTVNKLIAIGAGAAGVPGLGGLGNLLP